MYLIKVYDGPNDRLGITIHSPYTGAPKISTGAIKLKISGIDEFNFSFNVDNPGYRKIKPLITLIKVIDIKKKKTIFDGRILKSQYNMSSNGFFSDSYICESKLAYLHDSSQRFAEVRATIKDFFTMIINQHNNTIEPHKRFKVGNVAVTNSTDNVYRYLGYDKTYETIKDKLIDRLGGFLVLREENDGTYIDYLEAVGTVRNTKISIRKNLKSISKDVDITNIITRLVPLGESIESENEEDTGASQARLTIASVNNNIDYLDDLELQKEFGIIEKEVTWDDVTLARNLLSRGKEFLENQKVSLETIEIDAIDLSLINIEIGSFSLGDWYYIDNQYVTSYKPWQVVEITIDITNPQTSKLIFGDKQKTLTQFQASFNKAQTNVVELHNTVSRISTNVTTVNKSIRDVQNTVTTIQHTIDSLDIDNFEQFKQEVSKQLNSITNSVDNFEKELITLTESFETNIKSIEERLEALEER